MDFDTCNWSDADVVFANSTCFDDALMRNLATTASCLKKGSIFVTLTKRLPVSLVVLGSSAISRGAVGASVLIRESPEESTSRTPEIDSGRVMLGISLEASDNQSDLSGVL